MSAGYELMADLFLRAPYYSYLSYDPDRLPDVLADQWFRNALFLASVEFYRLIEAKAFDYHALLPKEKLALLKYYNRMCFRPVPYGSFASFTNVQWHPSGITRLDPGSQPVLHLLPDQRLIPAWPDGRQQFCLNPLLYRLDNQYRFIRSLNDGIQYKFSIDALELHPLYTDLFAYLAGGKRTMQQLNKRVCVFAGCTAIEAAEHLAFLEAEQVLLSAGNRSPVNPFPAKGFPGWPKRLRKEQAKLISIFGALHAKMQDGLPEKQLFYAALERPICGGGPAFEDRKELEDALSMLTRLAQPRTPVALKKFIAAFRDRFDLQEVSLLEAVDPDKGIAYDKLYHAAAAEDDLLQDIRFPDLQESADNLSWTPVHRMLFRLWQQEPSRDLYAPIELQVAELERSGISKSGQALPPTTTLVFRKTEDMLVLEQAGGATATAILGRFSSFSPKTYAICKQIALAEMDANPGVCFADIGHLSDRHVDNINRRKPVYNYEIPLNVFSVLPLGQQLLPADLLLSVRNNELILRSARLSKRVIPRLSSAYNHLHSGLGLFRLLCDLQYQGVAAALSLDPEQFFPGLSFYPRIYSGRVILSPAKWRFTGKELDSLLAGGTSQLRAFRQHHRLPQRVSMGVFDQQLVFDLTHPAESEFFLAALKGQQTVLLQEYLWPGRSVKLGHEPLAGQFVATVRNPSASYKPVMGHIDYEQTVTRIFQPGSEWLYLKLYCTPACADELLNEVLSPVLTRFKSRILRWFFVRYQDPEYHLRVRFQIEPRFHGQLLSAFQRAAAEKQSLIRSFSTDTYHRELERYGPEWIIRAESIFCAGSAWCLSQLSTNDIRISGGIFYLALMTAHQMIAAFIPDREEALCFCENTSQKFVAEFGNSKELKYDLDRKYRSLRPTVSRLDTTGITPVNGMAVLIGAVGECGSAATGLTEIRRHALLADLVHMQLNRTFSVRQREQELLTYYCLAKLLRSLKSRNLY